jgi:hypothetical protein
MVGLEMYRRTLADGGGSDEGAAEGDGILSKRGSRERLALRMGSVGLRA